MSHEQGQRQPPPEPTPPPATTLLPCPFCGGEAVLYPTQKGGMFGVMCDARCAVSPNGAHRKTPEEAVAAWNHQQAKIDAIACGNRRLAAALRMLHGKEWEFRGRELRCVACGSLKTLGHLAGCVISDAFADAGGGGDGK